MARFIGTILVVVAFLATAATAHAGGGAATITVAPQGAGSGSVVGQGSVSGAVIDCTWNGTAASGTCAFDSGGVQFVQIAATASPGSLFDGWVICPGDVSGPGGSICTFQVDDPTDDFVVRPAFARETSTLDIAFDGTGSGSVTSDVPGIACPPACVATFSTGTIVTVTAAAAPGSTFARWEGACADRPGPVCAVNVTGFVAVRAVFERAGECDILGTPGDDILVGTAADETICGLGGNDVIRAGGGDDVVLGGAGNDRLYGQGGDDELNGAAGRDRLYGASGSDVLRGGTGADTLSGGAAGDVLRGGGGVDVGNGGAGVDSCAALEQRAGCP